MSRQLHLFSELPKRARKRVRMGVVDAGCTHVHLRCPKCGYDTGWVETADIKFSGAKQNIDCPTCNAAIDSAASGRLYA